MKIKFGGLAAIAGAMLLSMALPVHGQTPAPATVNFTNIANPDIFGDGYVDPYVGTVKINGSQINNNGLIVCDDFDDNIYLPEHWDATALTASQLTTLTSAQLGADTLFGSTIGLDGYAAVASLVTQLLNLSPPNSPTSSANQLKQADLSAAIWYITSGGTKSGSTYTLEGYTLDANAASYVAAALAAYGTSGDVSQGTFTYSSSDDSTAALAELNASTNLFILTPKAPYPVTYGPNGGRPQEMWTADPVPEGGAALLYLMLGGGVCFGAMFLNRRNRFANLASA